MSPIQITITQAGLAALVDAQTGGTAAIRIAQVGLSDIPFIVAPTIDSLPGEFKRLDMVAGQAVSDTIIHLTATDPTAEIYNLYGIGLYLEDDTLFAVYSQSEPLFRKVAATAFLFAQDIEFADDVVDAIGFGDIGFLNPPATETVKGVAEIATHAEVATGTDDQRIVSPLKLATALQVLATAINGDINTVEAALASVADALAALLARTITGSGLASGGGGLTASRVLTVLAATAGDLTAGTATDRAITPAALSGLARILAQNGYAVLPGLGGLILQWGRFTAAPNATSSTLFPLTFPTACFSAVPAGGFSGGIGSQDNPPVLVESSITASGFSVFSADDETVGQSYIAVGI